MIFIDLYTSKRFLINLYQKFKEDETSSLATQLAYHLLLSVFPLLLFILTLLPYFSLPTAGLMNFISQHIPGTEGSAIANDIDSLLSKPRGGLLSLGLLVTLWTASNGVNALIRSINRAYGVQETRSFIRTRLLSLFLTMAMVVVVALTLLLPVFGQLFIRITTHFLFVPFEFKLLYHIVRWVCGIIIMVCVIMALYTIAPNEKCKPKEAFWGALVATFGWQAISFGFSIYVTNFSNYSATYGALGGVIILMIWFYLTGLILILGGQINATLKHMK
ncbi:YihY/virulence factor BrkB family protein [Alicyclobacillus fodiniaquatilis]|jgi:membrane protein|uniref:YihY/virulence factor BrkB family protein n=1 Tax=Alicyclobacillus fodiniaquatilis TaxID=1661150 RepID=A0ABW4JC67_9BACL